MFENKHEPLLSRHEFYVRLARSAAVALAMVAASLGVGMLGYHFLEDMPWMDAFANAAMILSGMGPFGPLKNDAGKLFAGCYALFSGLLFVAAMGVVFAPVVHRIMHRFQLEEEQDEKAAKQRNKKS